MTLADLIQIATDEGVDPKNVTLAFQADADSDVEGLDVLEGDYRASTSSTVFILTPVGTAS